ncbi:MAG: carbon-nitrogen hydrolase family protein [Gordonia sp. (in: high G+C Gram-positive bacteria)]
MKVTVGQFAPTAEIADNREAISRLADHAATAGSQLLVLPEEAMVIGSEVPGSLSEFVAKEWEPFCDFITELAQANNLCIVALGYEPSSSGLPYNTTIVQDSSGRRLAKYHKMHLYDAFSYQESSYVLRGDIEPTVFDLDGTVFGLINCYDVRFPELARALVEQGADTLLVSAAWVDGPLKADHWLTLLRARAIENTCWVVGVGSASPECIGRSVIIDPLGRVVGQLDAETWATLDAELDKSALDEARFTLPVLRNRRMMITGS